MGGHAAWHHNAVAAGLAVGGLLLLVAASRAMHSAEVTRLGYQVERWHARWFEEHENFRAWIADEHRRRRRA